MIECTTLDQQLDAYLAGRLSPGDAELLETHAVGCVRCGRLLEARSRLDLALPAEIDPDPQHRIAVLSRITRPATRSTPRRWLVPTALAAGALLAVGLLRPPAKSGQGPVPVGSPAALAAERADGQFRQLDAARAEVQEAIARSPGDAGLQQSLERLDAQRRSLENLIREFES